MMETLCCKCLNVRISSAQLFPVSQVPPPLATAFPSGAYQADFACLHSILKGVSCLCTTQKMGEGWAATRCWVCNLFTHAIHAESSTLLVSRLLQTFSINLQNQDHYSPLFKLLVPPLDNLTTTMTSDYGKEHERLIQDLVNNFFVQQKKDVEERIRVFSEQQYAQFNELQTQIRSHKFSLLSVLNKIKEMETHPSTQPKTEEPTPLPPAPPPQPDNKETESIPSLIPAFTKSPYLTKHLARKAKPQRSRSQPQELTAARLDSFGIFDLEGMEVAEDLAVVSSDGGDTDVEEPSHRTQAPPPRETRYAQSLPINVPWTTSGHSSDEDESERMSSADPSQIAANMQALSMSLFNSVWDRPTRQLGIQGLLQTHPILKSNR